MIISLYILTLTVCAELQGHGALFCRGGGGLVQTWDGNGALNHQLIQLPILRDTAHLWS